jgi:hypothetical protein
MDEQSQGGGAEGAKIPASVKAWEHPPLKLVAAACGYVGSYEEVRPDHCPIQGCGIPFEYTEEMDAIQPMPGLTQESLQAHMAEYPAGVALLTALRMRFRARPRFRLEQRGQLIIVIQVRQEPDF